jgi:hypothetical protein
MSIGSQRSCRQVTSTPMGVAFTFEQEKCAMVLFREPRLAHSFPNSAGGFRRRVERRPIP